MRLVSSFFGLGLSALASAQGNEPLTTERPGFSSSPFTVRPGTVQLEAGYQFQSDDSGGVDVEQQNLPLLLARIGLVDNVELQLGWGGYARAEVGNADLSGVTDASVGVKWQVTDSNAAVPVSLFAGVSVPIGDDEFSSDEADPTVGAFWSYSAGLDWFGTVLVTEPDDETILSNAVGISLPIDERIGSYVEYFGNYGSGSGPEHFLNGGFTYLSQTNLQWDASLAVGLNDRSADLTVGLGMAYRF
jgi:hypothetical protein